MRMPTYRFTAAPIDIGDLRMLGMGIHDLMPGGIVHRPHGLDGYLIIAVSFRRVTIRIHGVEHRFPAQSLVIWEPDERNAMAMPRRPGIIPG